MASQVAVPEFDGRIITVPFSFKEIDDDGLISNGRPGRCARVAGGDPARTAAPGRPRRVALVFSAYPTKHARIGNAVGDTGQRGGLAAQAMRRGYQVGDLPVSESERRRRADSRVDRMRRTRPRQLTEGQQAGNPIRVSAKE